MTESITQLPFRKSRREAMEEIIRAAAKATPYGKARYQMLKSDKVSSSSLKKALQIYDLRRPDDFPRGELLDRLIELLGLQGIDWPPTQIDRELVIEEKTKSELERNLRKLGFPHFRKHEDNGLQYLCIAPAEGKPRPTLPKDLQVPYLLSGTLRRVPKVGAEKK